ncbi:MetQ/NlpA family ABC transporter substrate-binding protein [Paenirhodobacter populi]|uniref:MetQ/NlpA family ABC transporter substrate-binding protein n=1 Tax=Paenirhodobacter populi TaxID=2306993 RepID=UPI000FE3E6EF|nr:MetQ/NlpA family ABC transporter substrate-binding protein [Sinirhodobacter populi]RWR05738.1 ABC transporter substrate-binding protein [Sinirhodobacter populi]
MKNMAKLAAVLATAFLCAGTAQAQETIRLGVSFYPFHSADDTKPDILDTIAPELAAEGYRVEKTVFLNYAEANPALAHGEIDGNLIQHELYMDIFNDRAGAELAIAQPVYHATFALYSGTYSDLNAIPDGETVFIPNDGVNTARALLLLQSAGLVTLREGATYGASLTDITGNPRNLKFVQLPLTATAGAYDEAGRTLAVMYPTFARSLELEGDAERLYVEERNDITDRYAISFVVNAKDLDDPKTKAVAQALRSDAVAEFLKEDYGWASTPAR